MDTRDILIISMISRKVDVLYTYKNLNCEKNFDAEAQRKITSDFINYAFKDDIGWANLLSTDVQPFVHELLFAAPESRQVSRYTFTAADYRAQKLDTDFSVINPHNQYYYVCYKFVDLVYVS